MPRTRPEGPKLEQYRGKWCIVWWDGANRRRISTGTPDERGARQALADFEAKLEKPPAAMSVADALDAYAKARESTVIAFTRLQAAAKSLNIGIGHLRVDQIGQAQWDYYVETRVTRPGARVDPLKHTAKKVSSGTLRREFNVLRAALRKAWKDGHLERPPALEPPTDSAPRDRFLTKPEARKLLAACETPHVRAFVAIALFTGARKGSILSLTWKQVNFTTGMIDFNEPGRRITNKRRAIVPITAGLLPELQAAHNMRQSEYVVEYGGRPVPTGLRWSFKRLCERADIGWVPTPHHLKHSVASWFAMERIPIDQAADWLATDPKTLRRVYRKFDPTYLRSVGSALDL